MKNFWNLLYLCLLWLGISVKAQSSFYQRTYYNAPPTHYFTHSGRSSDFTPLTYRSDSHAEESKRKEYSKKYAKKIPFRHVASEEDDSSSERYSSAEYSNEAHHFHSKENDSREYAIGTHIRVQHPITVPKKSTSSHYKYSTTHLPNHFKSNSYADFSTEAHDSKPPKYDTSPKKHNLPPHKYTQYFEPDPFHVVAPPKTSASSVSTTPSLGYNSFDTEQDDYEAHNGNSNRVKAQFRDRFKGVASQKQIEKYLEDQQKLLDEALKLQLLNNPKYQHLVKSKDAEPHYDEGEFEELPIDPQPPPIYRPSYDDAPSYKSNRARRRPKGSDLKRSPKSSKPPPPPGSSKRRFRPSLVISV